MSWALKKNVGEKKKGTGTPGWKDWLRPRPREGQGGAEGRVGSPDLLPQQPWHWTRAPWRPRAKKCKAEMWPTREALRKWVPTGRSQLEREGMGPPEAPQRPREAGGRQERALPQARPAHRPGDPAAGSSGGRTAAAAAAAAKSCPTLCDPIDVSPPGSPIPGILQARTLEWGAISFSNA